MGDRNRADSGGPVAWSVFGDSLGVAVFLGAASLAGLTWQVGFFITDSYAVANALSNAAAGHLTIERLVYSLTIGSQPGLHLVDGRVFARNYGQVALALPLYFLLEGVSAVTELGPALAGAWSLTAAAAVRQVGVVRGARVRWGVAGCVLGLAVFGASVLTGAPVAASMVGVVALQTLSALAVAVTALAVYRLLARLRGRRVAAAAAVGVVAATPLWFWATVPKRHTLTTGAVAVLVWWFAASRAGGRRVDLPVGGSVPKAVVVRAFAYLLAGFVCWVHLVEGAVLLGTFAAADLATARHRSRRTVLALAVVAALGLSPMLATNAALTGDPTTAPRFAADVEDGDLSLGPDGSVSVAREGESETAGNPTPTVGDTPESEGVVDALVRGVPFGQRVARALGEAPARLWHTYLRSGRASGLVDYGDNDQETIDLSLLESVPLAGGVLGATVVVGAAAGRRRRQCASADGGTDAGRARRLVGRVRTADQSVQTAGFAALVALGFATMYFPFLPLHSQLTVRYLLPVVPALVVGVGLVGAVGEAVESAPGALAGAYLGATGVGLAGVAVGLPPLALAVGEAMQLHGILNLAVAAVVTAGVARATAGADVDRRLLAGTLGVGAAATTVLVVAMQLSYFEYGVYAVPVVGRLAEAFAVLS